MSILDGILGQVASNVDIKNMAGKIGLTPEQVEMAVGALAKAHAQPGDTAEGAAAATGLPTDKLSEIIGQIGGEGALGKFAGMLQGQSGILAQVTGMLDKNQDGSVLDDLGGLASGMFGKK